MSVQFSLLASDIPQAAQTSIVPCQYSDFRVLEILQQVLRLHQSSFKEFITLEIDFRATHIDFNQVMGIYHEFMKSQSFLEKENIRSKGNARCAFFIGAVLFVGFIALAGWQYSKDADGYAALCGLAAFVSVVICGFVHSSEDQKIDSSHIKPALQAFRNLIDNPDVNFDLRALTLQEFELPQSREIGVRAC